MFVGAGVVGFRFTDYAAEGTAKIRELSAAESLRRFLLQVVPSPFGRRRPCGLLATRTRTDKLARGRHLLAVVAAAVTSARPPPTGETPAAGIETAPPARCPACGGGPLRVIAVVAPHRGIPP